MVGDLGIQSSSTNVVAEEVEVLFQEADGTDEAGGEDGADAEDVGAVVEAAEELGVHALVGVGTEDGFVGAGVVGVWVEWAVLEMGAFVVAC